MPPSGPPAAEAAIVTIGSRPRACAATFWSVPNSTLLDVADPVSATPSHPTMGATKGNAGPVSANAKPSVPSAPLRRITNASASSVAMVTRLSATRRTVPTSVRPSSGTDAPRIGALMRAESSRHVPVAPKNGSVTIARWGRTVPSGATRPMRRSRPASGVTTVANESPCWTGASAHTMTSTATTSHTDQARTWSIAELLVWQRLAAADSTRRAAATAPAELPASHSFASTASGLAPPASASSNPTSLAWADDCVDPEPLDFAMAKLRWSVVARAMASAEPLHGSPSAAGSVASGKMTAVMELTSKPLPRRRLRCTLATKDGEEGASSVVSSATGSPFAREASVPAGVPSFLAAPRDSDVLAPAELSSTATAPLLSALRSCSAGDAVAAEDSPFAGAARAASGPLASARRSESEGAIGYFGLQPE
mmetsp:Transcript_11675/g.45460  ORF Transcript_11675/g.45460 Transcript_11675/m.45460 type:complete len:425 (-) Transcript_11675:865-2139(-)